MASLYEFTSDTFSSSTSMSDLEKYASVPKSLYEHDIPTIIIPDASDFEAFDFPACICDSEDEKYEVESTTPNTIVVLESYPDSDSDSDSEVDDVSASAPPAYTPELSSNSTAAPTPTKRSLFTLKSIFSSCLGRRRTPHHSKSSSPVASHSAAHSVPPPPYVSKEEIELIEERMRQLDIFFGGAPL